MTAGDTGALRLWQRAAVASYLLLIVDIVVWETWGAPAKQVPVYIGLALKLAPLLAALIPILQRNAKVYMWASLLMLLYFTEGLVLGYSEFNRGWGVHNELVYASLEVLLSTIFIVSAGTYIRNKYPRYKKT